MGRTTSFKSRAAKYRSTWRRLGRTALQTTVLSTWLHTNFRVTVRGLGNLADLPLDGAFVIVANHQSHLDTPLIMGSLPRRLAARVAVAAASDYFFKNYWQSKPPRVMFNTFPIDRPAKSHGRASAQPHRGLTNELVSSGVPVLIFPEGTRSRTGQLGPFHSGPFRIAQAAGVPIVPVVLTGTRQAWPVGARRWRSGRPAVAINFLPPIQPSSTESVERLADRARQIIQDNLRSGG